VTPRHGVVVLAAGGSRRLGRPKQLIEIDGETLLHRATRAALATRPADLVVVLGHQAALLAETVSDLAVRCIDATSWQHGMGHSLRCGADALDPDCAGVLVVLCDQPALDAAHLRQLVACWREAPQEAAASGYAQIVGVPALLPRDWLRGVEFDGDRGARGLLRARAAETRVVMNEALARDIDLPGDLPADGDE
jgi:CTP:molybdopterin cytidylyltransferase MocA